jgi:TusA-related sulfurtransferase
MERSDILAAMGELKLYGMRSAYDGVLAMAVKRQHELQQVVGDLLKAQIDEKQARSDCPEFCVRASCCTLSGHRLDEALAEDDGGPEPWPWTMLTPAWSAPSRCGSKPDTAAWSRRRRWGNRPWRGRRGAAWR